MSENRAEVRRLAINGNFKRNLGVLAILEVEEDLGQFRSWRSLEDFKQKRGGQKGGRARAGWRSLARRVREILRVTKGWRDFAGRSRNRCCHAVDGPLAAAVGDEVDGVVA